MTNIEILNKMRGMELQVIIQYMSQHYYLANIGMNDLAGKMKEIAIAEMKHAEKLGERIRDLGDVPLSVPAAPLKADQECAEIYEFNTSLEETALKDYNVFAKMLRELSDEISADLVEDLLEDEQEHFNYFSNIENYIERFGDVYLAVQAKG